MFGELKDYNYKDSTIQNKLVFIKTIDVWIPNCEQIETKPTVGSIITKLLLNIAGNSNGNSNFICMKLFIKQAFFLDTQLQILLLHKLNLMTLLFCVLIEI